MRALSLFFVVLMTVCIGINGTAIALGSATPLTYAALAMCLVAFVLSVVGVLND